MERIHLMARAGGLEIAAAYVQPGIGGQGWRIYPAAGSRLRWIGASRLVRFADGTERLLVITEVRPRAVAWLTAREV
jgi:hypothetical protein